MLKSGWASLSVLIFSAGFAFAEPLIIDHHNVDITQLTEAQINRAKSCLHIAYGHTSHGSQVTDGMNGLVGFANGGGKGLSLPVDIFAWNNGGTGGALDLHDYAMSDDVGYYPQWYNETVSYLENPANSNVNVIIWSWCGQMSGKHSSGTLTNEYLLPMSNLETSYPDVVFVYMTGHVDIWDDANQKGGAQTIREYCIANDKVLYDFEDIERYDPDGTYYQYVNDDCAYYTGPGSGYQGNWAIQWQTSHTENADWYDCGSAHSQPLNANQKAYAAWALWCALGADLDRDGIADEWEERFGGTDLFSGGPHDQDGDTVCDRDEFVADTVPTNSASYFALNHVALTPSCTISFPCSTGRVYSLLCRESLVTGQWSIVEGQTNVWGSPGGQLSLMDPDDAAFRVYRVGVALP